MAEDWANRALILSQDAKNLDFVIECEGYEFKVNRLMTSAHSRYFEKLFATWTLVGKSARRTAGHGGNI